MSNNKKFDLPVSKKIKSKSEQFEQIVEAILARKYSWACVLILQVLSYNPRDYLPERTYSRLRKKNLVKSSKQS